MYLPSHFEQKDEAALRSLMRAHPLATLVTLQDGAPTADHVPLEYDAATRTLRGHVARANPLWQAAAGHGVLAVFCGPQAYVTPSWYPSKAQSHKVVPTWNYAVVHAHGTLHAVEEAPWLHALVSRLTAHHERPRERPWAVADAPADYVQQMLRAIVGIEIAVERLVGKWKLSQNRNESDRLGVADGLDQGASASRAVARLVRDPAAPPEETA
jgi:transcriptional regulator